MQNSKLTKISKKSLCTFISSGLTAVLSAALLSGCSFLPNDTQEHKIVLSSEENVPEYELSEVTRGEVVLTEKIYCNYQEEEGEELSFAEEGRKINEVYVQKGSEVKKGTLIAELECEDLKEEKAALEYTIRRNNLLKSQTQETLEFNISEYQKLLDEHKIMQGTYDVEVGKLNRAANEKNEDFDDAIAVASIRLSEVKTMLDGCYLYAGMDGTVSYVSGALVKGGTDFKSDSVLVRIIDMSHCVFYVDEEKHGEYFDYFTPGEEITIKSNTSVECEVIVQPYEPEKGGLRFELKSMDNDFAIGDRMFYLLELGRRDDVLMLPKNTVHYASGKYYVYVFDAGGLKSMRYVEAGLVGDSYIEIISGLEEGDIVIKK